MGTLRSSTCQWSFELAGCNARRLRCRQSIHSHDQINKLITDWSQFEPNAVVSDACASYNTLDSLNRDLSPLVKSITTTTDFFAYYRLNLFNQECPFWNDASSMCGNIACAVNTIENERDVPLVWRTEKLSKLEGPKAQHPGRTQQQERGNQKPLQGNLGENVGESCVVEYDDECDDRNYCVPEDETASSKGDYVSLLDNPERYTGYGGPSSHMVWDAIYKENCFTRADASGPGPNKPSTAPFKVTNDLRSVLQANSPREAFVFDESCLEKRVFHRVISGMHASISTHICFDQLNQTTGEWGPNLACYQDRLGNHPDRISNLYFNYALLLRAVTKLNTHLANYTFCSGDSQQDTDTKTKVLQLASKAASGPAIFDEHTMFRDPVAAGDMKEDFRQRFRNVSRIMDCVGCDKCRLWGKLQTAGYGTALKVLFDFDEGSEISLKRKELVSLINTLARVSHSLDALASFRRMEAEQVSTSRLGRSLGDDAHPADFEDDFDTNASLPEPPPSAMDELHLVYRTFRYVLWTWWNLPKVLYHLAMFELTRIWAFWLGLRVPERTYVFTIPRREDL